MTTGQGSKVTPEFLEKLKLAVSIVEVVGEHVVLRKSGSNFTGLCPFHSERSPSFSVSDQKGLYHCYGCKAGGDLVKFVMEIHGLSFIEAVEELAGRGKIAMPKDWMAAAGSAGTPEAQAKRALQLEKLALAYKLNRFAAAFFHQQISGQPHIDQYFRARGITDLDLQRSFYIGAAPASWDGLAHHLVAKKAPIEMAVELGLVRPSQKTGVGPGFFDLFRNRAMFPILDNRGRVAGFGGRALALPEGAPDVGGESPKYLNSPESLIFQKGKLAFGLYQAQKHIREKDETILVEGYFDVLALHAAGFRNVVATCGTSLTPDHLTLFQRFGTRVTVLFDGDKAGVAATERAMEVGLDHGVVVYGAAMPPNLDPDELLFDQKTGKPLPEGIVQMQGILAATQPILDTRVQDWVRKSVEGAESKTQAIKQIGSWLARFRDPVGREVRLESIAQQLGISRELLQRGVTAATPRRGASPPALEAAPPRPAVSASPQSPPRPPADAALPGPRGLPQPLSGRPTRKPVEPQISAREKVILQAIVRADRFPELVDEIGKKLPAAMTFSDLFDYAPARDFMALLLQNPSSFSDFRAMPSHFLDSIEDLQVRSTLTEAALGGGDGPSNEDILHALGVCTERAWARFSQLIKVALDDAEAKKDEGLRSQLLKEYLDVRRRMKEFNSFYDEA